MTCSPHGEGATVLDVPIVRLLASAALERGLRSVLLHDAGPVAVEHAAALAQALLAAATGAPAGRVTLDAADEEEDLWGRYVPHLARGGLTLVWQPGPLVQETAGLGRIVVIHDLVRASLPVVRAAVALTGAEVAHVERDGVARAWRPDLLWLAACPRAELGRLSPHLLDRFVLRAGVVAPSVGARTASLRSQLAAVGADGADPAPPAALPADVAARMRAAAAHRPADDGRWLARIERYLPADDAARGAGWRRALALARLTVAQARLDLAPHVSDEHLARAAALLGLRETATAVVPAPAVGTHGPADAATAGGAPADAAAEPVGTMKGPEAAAQAASAADRPVGTGETPAAGPAPVFRSEQEAVLASLAAVEGNPFPEDTQPAAREPGALRLPARRAEAGARRGPAVGVEPSRTLTDLAVASTLIQAAIYQPVRRRNAGAHDRAWLLLPEDVRGHRRAPVPEQLLVLVLDHSALADCAWEDAVQPHLHWAYVERAAICVISVGPGPEPLRAERLVVRNLLAPQLAVALTPRPARATPLAHGLELALQTLRQGLQHGRGAARQARLVVLTDGRGNVPLAASHGGETPAAPVGAAAVGDALEVARLLGQLKHVRAFALDPQPRHYAGLPRQLAERMSATVVHVAGRGARAAVGAEG